MENKALDAIRDVSRDSRRGQFMVYYDRTNRHLSWGHLMLTALIIAVAISVLSLFPLMGLPGVLLVRLLTYPINAALGPMTAQALEKTGDNATAFYCVLAIVWPFMIPGTLYAMKKFNPVTELSTILRVAAFSALLIASVTVLTIALVKVWISTSQGEISDGHRLAAALNSDNTELAEEFAKTVDFSKWEYRLFTEAISEKKYSSIDFLLELRAKASKDDGFVSHMTPLQLAVAYNNADVTKYLLEKGEDPNFANKEGETPLHYLKFQSDGDLSTLQLLKEHGADFTVVDRKGNTPLHSFMSTIEFLSFPKASECAALLIHYGVDPEARNNEGRIALSYPVGDDEAFKSKVESKLESLSK